MVAKEIIIGTLGTLYSSTAAITNSFMPLAAYAFLIFVLLYVHCIGVIAVIKKETNSWRWPIFTVFYTTFIAWLIAFVVYQCGSLIGLA